MAQFYVIALMETRNASKKRGIGKRSFWLCHSGPYPDAKSCDLVARDLTGEYGLTWRAAWYYCVDSFPVRDDELEVYGLNRKAPEYQTLLPGMQGVK